MFKKTYIAYVPNEKGEEPNNTYKVRVRAYTYAGAHQKAARALGVEPTEVCTRLQDEPHITV